MTQPSKRNILEQGRAKRAYEFAETGSKLNSDKKVDRAYRSYVKKIPMLIKTNGLGATFAFVKAKATKNKSKEDKRDYAYEVIYQQTRQWLEEIMPHLFQDEQGKALKNTDLVCVIINKNSSSYRQVTVEIIAFFTWLKRFSEGLIVGEDDGSD